ncbi:MAG: peptidoglycan binding protein CsiV [Sulfuricaulis sp.]|uniref:CsiV family protein n=1 Tax=Sulfuricaulis sp. TaxID=2003553 RepID=UPI0025FA85BC|nr:CsiV family protein [Sulfuricaulis sp.]MCR4345797.1 peptidoglycan binding protein CsiV [Sulfuricaulis sp.]
MKRLFLMIFLITAPVTTLQAAPAATNMYEIEIVVFENRLSDLEGGELWTRGMEKPANAQKNEAVGAGEKPPADSPLSAASTALEKSGRHHVLAHLRWQQSAEAKSVSKPVKISNVEGGLDGSLRFYLSRFLILDLNLGLREMQSGGIFSGVSEKDATVYRLNEPRRIKVSETQYFDHPKFGALVRVSPAKATGQP